MSLLRGFGCPRTGLGEPDWILAPPAGYPQFPPVEGPSPPPESYIDQFGHTVVPPLPNVNYGPVPPPASWVDSSGVTHVPPSPAPKRNIQTITEGEWSLASLTSSASWPLLVGVVVVGYLLTRGSK